MTLETFAAPAAVAVAEVPREGLAALADWVSGLVDAESFVSRIVDTPFFPKSHWPDMGQGRNEMTMQQRQQGRPIAIATGTAAVLQGITLGLDPLTALAKIYVVHGVPGLYSKIKVALVQSKGHEIWTEDNTDERCVVNGRRKGSDRIESVTITMAQARKAGWTRNPTYEKTPADMLWNRAAGRVADRVGADVLHGIASVEDIEDEAAQDKPTTATRVVQRAAAPAAIAAPAAPVQPASLPHVPRQATPAGPPLPGDDEPPVDPNAITDAQLRKLGAVFGQLGVAGPGSREKRLTIASRIAGRELASSKDLTLREAGTLIDTLEAGGRKVVAEILNPPAEQAEAEPSGPPLPGDDEIDPTLGEDWPPMDGAEAEAEGR